MVAVANVVHQQATTTGTGDFTLASVNGKQSFNSAFGTGGTNVFYYMIMNLAAAEYEYGTGHLSSSTVLVRDTVIGGSNSTSLVNFSAGTKDVCCDIEASKQIINPLTTRGDILLRDASGPARLALGANLKLLQSNGTDPVWGDAEVYLNGGNITASSATLDIVLTSYTAFSALHFILKSVMPTTDGQQLGVRFSTDGGSTFLTAANYGYCGFATTGSGTDVSGRAAGATIMQLCGSNSSCNYAANTTSGGGDVELLLIDQAATAHYTRAQWHQRSFTSLGQMCPFIGSGCYQVAQDTDAIRFFFTGNFHGTVPGSWKLYGIP